MRTFSLLATLPLIPLIYAKVIPIPRSVLLKGREYWTDVTFSPSLTSTLGSTSISTASGSATTTQSDSLYQYIDPDDYDADDYADGVLLFMQDELYTLLPDSGIEFDCPDNFFTMYFDESVVINGSLQEWGETFESGIMIIPNNWTSYCGDISDWTLYGYSSPDVVFDNSKEEEEYYDNINDPEIQFVVVVLHDLVDINWLNRSITFEAYADDFRAIIGALTTAPEEYDYFTPGPIGNSTGDDIDFFDTNAQRRDLSASHLWFKRGVTDLVNVAKALPSWGKVTTDVLKNTITLVNQGMRISHISDVQKGSLEKPFTDQDVTIDLDLSNLPQYPGWEGFTYQLYQFYYDGKYWVELWRTAVSGGNHQISSSITTDSGTSSVPSSTSVITTTTNTQSSSVGIPSCTWRPNKEPLDKPSGSWKNIFKIDAEKLVTTGNLPFPFKLLDIPGVVRAGKEATDAISSAQQVLKRFTILSRSTTTTGVTVISTTAASTPTTASSVVTTTTGPINNAVAARTATGVSAPQPTQALSARQDDGTTSFYDNCDVSILDWDIQFMFGNTSATVFPPTVSLHNYALKNKASIQLTCRDRFFETRETEYLRITSVPIGGCATQLGDFEIDAFFVLFLSSVFSSGSNGSITIDYSYTWDPIDFELELLGGGPDDTIQLNATKLGIGLPSSSGLKFDYLRATASFPNIEVGFALSPAFQVDVITPLLNYTRGIMLGPAINLLSNGTFSVGYGSRSSRASATATTTTSSAPQSDSSTDTTTIISDGSDFGNSTDVVNLNLNSSSNNDNTSPSTGVFAGSSLQVLTGMSWGLMWTDYTYQKLGGPLSSVLKLPTSRSKVGWLYGPYKFWSRDPSL